MPRLLPRDHRLPRLDVWRSGRQVVRDRQHWFTDDSTSCAGWAHQTEQYGQTEALEHLCAVGSEVWRDSAAADWCILGEAVGEEL